jgi:hypothetical protein
MRKFPLKGTKIPVRREKINFFPLCLTVSHKARLGERDVLSRIGALLTGRTKIYPALVGISVEEVKQSENSH